MQTTSTTERELLELEKQYWRALKDKDVDAALRLTDFPCIITGAQGIGAIEKQAFAAMIADPPYTIRRVELDDAAQVRMLSDDTAVLAYKVHEELTVDGQAVALDAADSSTWVKRNGGWRCALHSEAIVGDPFGRDRAGSARRATTGRDAPSTVGEDEHAIRTAIASWLAAARLGDAEKQLALIADDGVFMVPGRAPFDKEAFARAAHDMRHARVEADGEVEELVVHGDWAWSRVRLDVMVALPQATAMRRSGYTLTIWRKQGGRWQLARDANLLTTQ